MRRSMLLKEGCCWPCDLVVDDDDDDEDEEKDAKVEDAVAAPRPAPRWRF